MVRKTISYIDYDGNQREEDFYFNLSKADLLEMMADAGVGGLDQMLKNIVATKDSGRIYRTFKDIIMKSYGEKSIDGRRFIKSKELSEGFVQTEAFSNLLMEFFENPESASKFINGLVASANTQTTESTNVVNINS